MQYLNVILVICSLSVAFCHPQLKKRDDDYEEKHDRVHHRMGSSLFGDDFGTDFFQPFNNLMRSLSDMLRQQIDGASHMLRNWGKGIGFNFNMDDITTNSTVNSSETHTEQVGNNYVITNITRLDKVDKNGQKYRIINKNVRVKPVNGSEDILNSDRTYVIMDSDKIPEPTFSETPRVHNHKSHEDRSDILPNTSHKSHEDRSEILPNTSHKSHEDRSEILPNTSTEKFVGEKENVDTSLPEIATKRPWEKVDPNVMFDSKKNQIVTDVETNEVKK